MENLQEKSEIGKRVEDLIHELRLNNNSFGLRVGIKPTNIKYIITGHSNPSYDALLKILNKFPDVNTEWLLLGKGEMFNNQKTTEKKSSDGFSNISNQLSEFEEKIEKEYRQIIDEKDKFIAQLNSYIAMLSQRGNLGKLALSEDTLRVTKRPTKVLRHPAIAHTFANSGTNRRA